MKRLSIEEYAAFLALCGKSRSEDDFTRTACVGVRKDKSIIGISYNGLKSGFKVPDWMKLEENRHRKSDLFIHAEDNLFKMISGDECDMVVSVLSPCFSCAKRIATQGVRKVVYLKEYPRCQKFRDVFDFYGIIHEKLSDESKANIWAYINDRENFEELF